MDVYTKILLIILVTEGATVVRKTMTSSSGTGQPPQHSETMTVTQTGADGKTVTYTSSDDGKYMIKSKYILTF